MRQSYKIFFNASVLWLASDAGQAEIPHLPLSKNAVEQRWAGKKKLFSQAIDWLQNGAEPRRFVIVADDLEQLWVDFSAKFKIVEAAGGFVLNPKNELLLIFRRGSWDLPKGKIDPGESRSEAALREVEEETGLQRLALGEPLTATFHTYEQKGAKILKPTYWFDMKTTETDLVPQVEEDIEQAIWAEPRAFLASDPIIFGSIRDVIEAGIAKQSLR